MEEVKQRLREKIRFKQGLQRETVDLLERLLEKDSQRRIGLSRVFEHAALKKREREFQRPIAVELQVEMIKNYMGNVNIKSNRTLPKTLKYLLDNNKIKFVGKNAETKTRESLKQVPIDFKKPQHVSGREGGMITNTFVSKIKRNQKLDKKFMS